MNYGKTILINLFSILAMDNFSLPGGVLDELVKTKKPDTRIVFLTAEKLSFRLDKYVNGRDLVREIIDTYPPKGLIQKLFQFFYSFLIFTGSTRILATFGARADIPPAGGNRHMAPLKALVASTFGRSRFVKVKLTPWIFKIVFRNRPYKSIFDKYGPTLVFAPSIAFFPDVELVSEAKRRGIKTIGMATNWDHLNKYYIPVHSDLLLVQNEPMKREAVNWHCYKEDQVAVVGFPQFDMYAFPDKYLIPRQNFLRTFNIGEGEKIILFISGAAYSLDEPDIIDAISKWIQEGKFGKAKLLVRPYAIARDMDLERKKYEKFQNNPAVVFNWLRRSDSIENKKYFMSMLSYADAVISIFSTTAIESAIFDKPTITIGFDGYKKRPYSQSIVRLEDMSHFRNVLDTDSVKVARGFDDLLATLSKCLTNPKADESQRRSLVAKMCGKINGGSGRRIAEIVLSHAR